MPLGYCFFNSYVYVSAGPPPTPYMYSPFTGAVVGTGASTFDRTWNIEVDPQQFVYVCGLYNASANIYDRSGTVIGTLPTVTGDAAFACKFSNVGTLQYSLVVDSAGSDIAQSLTIDSTSNVYLTGYYTGTPNIILRSNLNASTTLGTLPASTGSSVFSCKFSSTGTLLYSFVIDGSGSDGGYSSVTDSLNSVYVGGSYNGTPNIVFRSNSNVSTTLGTLPISSGDAAFTTKFSSTGGLLYSFVVDATTNNDISWALACDAFSNVYFGGQYNGTPNIVFRSNSNVSTTLGTLPATLGTNVSFATKCNDIGALQYSLIIDGTGSDIGYSLACDTFSNIYIGGQYAGTPNIIFRSNANVSTTVGTLSAVVGSLDGFVTKFSSTGTLQYSYIMGGGGADGVFSVSCDTNSNVVVGGYYNGTPSIFRRSNANVSVLVDTFPTSANDSAFMSKFDSNGRYFFSITADSSVNDVNYTTSTDQNGNLYFGGQNQNATLRDVTSRQFLNYSIITPTQPPPPRTFPLDALSSTNSLTGTYSLRRVLTSYAGPVANIRRSADNVTADIFGDFNGVLTLSNATPVSTWLGASTGFVTTWYDQSGNVRHASQAVTGSQPTLDVTNVRVNFASPTNAFLEIASPGCMPIGDGLYTVVLRHGALSTGLNLIFGSGTAANGVDVGYDATNTRYFTRWNIASATSDVCSQNGTTGTNNVVTYRYINAGGALASKEFWVNGNQSVAQQTFGSSGTAKNTATSNNYVGRALATGTTFYANTQLSFISIFSSALSNTDRIIVETQDAAIFPLPPIPARLGAYYARTTPTGSTSIPQLGYYTNFVRIINASSEVRGLACDSGSNIYASYFYSGTTPTIINQNSTIHGSLPTSTGLAGALTKFDSVGTVLFSRIVESAGNDSSYSVAVDSTQSNVYLGTNLLGSATIKDQAGNTLGTTPIPLTNAALVSKFSTSTGNYQYSLMLDASGGGNDVLNTVSCDPFSNIYFGGYYTTGTINVFYISSSNVATRMGTFSGNNSGFLTKCDQNGNLLYTLIVNTGGGIVQSTQGSVCDPTGNVYMSGYNFNAGGTIVRVSSSNVSTTLGTIPTPSGYAAFTVKCDLVGNLLYSLYIDSAGSEVGYSVSCDSGSNVYVVGQYNGTPNIIFRSNSNVSTTIGTLPTSTVDSAFLSKFSVTGSLLYSYTLDSAGTDISYSTTTDLTGNVYFTGEYNGTPTLRYISNANVATTVTTLPASFGIAAYMISISPAGTFNYARIIDATTNADRGYAVACDPGGNIFFGGVYNGITTIRDHLGTTIGTLPNLGSRGFITKFAGSSTPIAQTLPATLSNVFYTTVPFMNATNESRLVDTDVDTSGNVFFLSQRTTTAPVLTSKNAVGIKTMPASTTLSTSLVKFNNKGLYEWDIYATNFGVNGSNIMCSLTHENSNVYIGSQQTAANVVTFYNTSNVSVADIPASVSADTSDCYVAKFDTNGTFQWKSYVQGSQNFFPSVAASPNDNAVYLAGTKGTAQMNVFSTSNVSVGTIPSTIGSFAAWSTKYNRDGVYQWRTYIDSSNVFNRGVTTDSKSNVYITGYFTGTTTANVFASTGSTRATAITKSGTNDAVYLVKYLTDGSFSWYTFMNTTSVGGAQQFGNGCDPKSNVYVSGFTTPNMDIFDRTDYLLARTTIPGASGFLVKFSEDGFYQWYANVYSPTNVTFDKVGTDIDFDAGSNVYATFSFLTPSVGATSTVTIRDGLGAINTIAIGVINASFNMVVKFSESGVFQWACPQTTVVPGRCNSALSVFGSNVYTSGTKLTTATTVRDRNFTNITTIPVTTSNAAYMAQYFTDGTYAFNDFQVTNFIA